MFTDRRFTKPPSLRYVTRSETGRHWRVHYVRGLDTPIQVYFSDVAHGSKEAALEAAKVFRDQVIAKKKPDALVKQRRNLRHLDKTAPYIGITLFEDKRKGRDRVFCWRAAYMEGDRQQRRSWSIRKYGYEEAFRLASAFRHQMTGQPMGKCPPPTKELLRWLFESSL